MLSPAAFAGRCGRASRAATGRWTLVDAILIAIPGRLPRVCDQRHCQSSDGCGAPFYPVADAEPYQPVEGSEHPGAWTADLTALIRSADGEHVEIIALPVVDPDAEHTRLNGD